MMPKVPLDIWFHVAQFLPDDVLRDLFSVNFAFFKISMDRHYRVVCVDMLSHRMLDRLG
jgi:hypothetical protein